MTPLMPAGRIPYVVITPVRDEGEHISATLESMLQQTCRPIEWIIVDDGSNDNTQAIVSKYAARYPWITALHRHRSGPRQNGSAVMEAFYYGYHKLTSSDWQYLAKLDGDVSFAHDYFEQCLQKFLVDPMLGIGGGLIWNRANGRPRPEPCPLKHVRGATKIYRRRCWEAIGGLLRTPGWDTVDEVKANMAGWKVRSFRDIKVIQHRPTGAGEGGWRNALKDGRADYVTGYHPLFMLLKCTKRLMRYPYLMGSLGLLCGFIGGYLNGGPRIDDRAAIRYVRQQQLRRLLFLDSIWD